jgi:hypothetical protein
VENKEKYECEIKMRNLEKKLLEGKSNIKKYNYQKKENDKFIKQLENDKITINTLLTSRQYELDKINQKLREINGDGNNENKSPQNENNKNLLNSQISPIKSLDINNIEINDNNIENMINENENVNIYKNRDSYQTAEKNKNQTIEINLNGNTNNGNNIQNSINNRYSSNLNNNINKNNDLGKNTYDKKMILQQLDMQKDKENNAVLDKSLNLKKNKLKPNFSFTLNDKKANDKKDIKPNLSVAVLPKTENNVNEKLNEGDGDGEIKEEIQSNNDLNDDKINNDNYPKINSNLSQNISMEKDDKGDNVQNEVGNKRENDLNTLPINAFDDGEKKFNNIDDDNNFNDVSNSNEQEHVFDN